MIFIFFLFFSSSSRCLFCFCTFLVYNIHLRLTPKTIADIVDIFAVFFSVVICLNFIQFLIRHVFKIDLYFFVKYNKNNEYLLQENDFEYQIIRSFVSLLVHIYIRQFFCLDNKHSDF